MTQEGTLTLRRTVGVNSTEVFRAFTNQGALRDWLCNAAQVEPRRGGRIYLWWNDGYYASGVFTEIKRGESLAFTWQGPGDPTGEVQVSLNPQGEGGGTEVTVTHNGIGSEVQERRLEKLWEGGLENLQSVLETGEDLRFTRRPMFGLREADEMTSEIAERIGAPVSEGILLKGLVEGMGAEAAGIEKGDVVVAIGGRDVLNFPTFVAALEPHQAGDRVPVTFYRGSDKRTVDMELSRRPMPELPTTLEALVDGTRQSYATVDKELDELLEGVSEEAAERRPAPDDWNAKLVLAHLIAVEHDLQTWIVAMIEDADLEQFFHSNGRERLEAIVGAYGSLAAIAEELKRSEAVNVALLASLSAETAGHKHLFNQLAQWFTTFGDHHREHFGEIKRLIGSQ